MVGQWTGAVAALSVCAAVLGCADRADPNRGNPGAPTPTVADPREQIRRAAWRPVLDGTPTNASVIVAVDLSRLPPDLELPRSCGDIPRTGFLVIHQQPRRIEVTQAPPAGYPDSAVGVWWGRRVIRWQAFADESLDALSAEGSPALEKLYDAIGERTADQDDKLAGWPADDSAPPGYWLQVSAKRLRPGPAPAVGRPIDSEFAVFGAGWAFAGCGGGTWSVSSVPVW